ncbi:MAG: ferritin-like domain-containing protein [Candidatus Anammoxibacter sp.]
MSKQTVIKILNEIRRSELTAISQYMAHHYYLRSMGYSTLAEEAKLDSFDEMKHAALLSERILDLDGDPEFTPLETPHKKGSVASIIKADFTLEEDAIKRLNKGIKTCIESGDATSRQLLEEITKMEETHILGLKQHLEHLKNFGNDYLLKLIGAAEAAPAAEVV